MPERKFTSTGDRTRNHQVTSPTLPPLNHLGGASSCNGPVFSANGKLQFIYTGSERVDPIPHNPDFDRCIMKTLWEKEKNAGDQHFLRFAQCFPPYKKEI